MSLRLYLDDCTCSKQLTAKLRAVGHNVVIPIEEGTSGLPDRQHLEHAVKQSRILMTHNCDDFEELHRESVQHCGIVAIYQDNDRRRDMSYDDIVNALQHLESSGLAFENSLHVLNVWR